MRILVTGSRFARPEHRPRIFTVLKWVGGYRLEPHTLVYGKARGVDTLAEDCATELGWDLDPHPADWDRLGRAAGIIRNQQMIETRPGPAICVGFPLLGVENKGTRHCMEHAWLANIPVLTFPLT